MSIVNTTPLDAEMPPWPVRRFSVEEYRQLGECGVLTPEDRVKLLEGWIVPKMNQRPAHRFAAGMLNEWLQRNLPPGYFGLCQLPITTPSSEPEPDLSVIRGTRRDFRQSHPTGTDCRLVIEVADASVLRDRHKAAIYAAAGVAEYWILNLIENQLEQYSQVGAESYDSLQTRGVTETVALQLGEVNLQLELSTLFD